MNKKVKKNAGLIKKNSTAKTAENNSQVLAGLLASDDVLQNQQEKIVEKHDAPKNNQLASEDVSTDREASATFASSQAESSSESLEQIIATNWSEVAASDITLVADNKDGDKGGILSNDNNGWGWLAGLGLLGGALALGGGGGGGSAPPAPSASITLTGISGASLNSSHHVVNSTTDVVVTGTVGGDVHNGDTVTLTVAGHTYTGTVSGGAFTITMTGAGAYMYLAGSGNIAASVSTTTSGGTATANAAPLAYLVDTLPTPHITVGNVTSDNVLTYAEGVTANHSTAANVTITGAVTGCANGDVVTLHYGNSQTATYTLTGLTSGAGSYTFTVLGSDLYGASVDSVSVSVSTGTAVGSGGAGVASANASDVYTVSAPVPAITIDLVANDGVVSHVEATNTMSISGHVTGDYKAGDTIHIQFGGPSYGSGAVQTTTTTVNADGTWSVNVDKSWVEYNGASSTNNHVYAHIDVGSGSETGAANASQTYAVHDATYNLSISNLLIAGDNVLNNTEAAGNVHVTGLVSGDFQAGDLVTLRLDGGVLATGHVLDDAGHFDITVSGATLANATSQDIYASVTHTDAWGNSGTASTDQTYTENFGFNHVQFSDNTNQHPDGQTLTINQSYIHTANVSLDWNTNNQSQNVSGDGMPYVETINVDASNLSTLNLHVYSEDYVRMHGLNLEQIDSSRPFDLNVRVNGYSTVDVVSGDNFIDFAAPANSHLNIWVGSSDSANSSNPNNWHEGSIDLTGSLVNVSAENLTVNLTVSGDWYQGPSHVENLGDNRNLINVYGNNASVDGYVQQGWISADSDVINVQGSDASVWLKAAGSGDIYSGNNLVEVNGQNAFISVDAHYDSRIYASGDIVNLRGSGANVTVSSDLNSQIRASGDIVNIAAGYTDSTNVHVVADRSSDIISNGDVISNYYSNGGSFNVEAYRGSEIYSSNDNVVDNRGAFTSIHVLASADSYIHSSYDVVYNAGWANDITVHANNGSTVRATGETYWMSSTEFHAQPNVVFNSAGSSTIQVSSDNGSLVQANWDIVRNTGESTNINVDAHGYSEVSADWSVDNGFYESQTSIVHTTANYVNVSVEARDHSQIHANNGYIILNSADSGWNNYQYLTVSAEGNSNIYAGDDIVETNSGNTNVTVTAVGESEISAWNIVESSSDYSWYQNISVEARQGSHIHADNDIVKGSFNNWGGQYSYDAHIHVGSYSGSSIDSYNTVVFSGDFTTVDVEANWGSSIHASDNIVELYSSGSGSNWDQDPTLANFKLSYDWGLQNNGIDAGIQVIAHHWSDIVTPTGDVAMIVGSSDVTVIGAVASSEILGNVGIDAIGYNNDSFVLASSDSVVATASNTVQVNGNRDYVGVRATDHSFIGAGVAISADGSWYSNWWTTSSNSPMSANQGDLVSVHGNHATVDIVADTNSTIAADQNILHLRGNDALVNVNISYDSSLFLSGDSQNSDAVFNVHGNSSELNLTADAHGWSAHVSVDNASLALITGNNNHVTIVSSADAQISSDGGIHVEGFGSHIVLDAYDGGDIAINNDNVVTLNGDSNYVELKAVGSYADISADNSLVWINGSDNHVVIESGWGGSIDNQWNGWFGNSGGYGVHILGGNNTVDIFAHDSADITVDQSLVYLSSDVMGQNVTITTDGYGYISSENGSIVEIWQGSSDVHTDLPSNSHTVDHVNVYVGLSSEIQAQDDIIALHSVDSAVVNLEVNTGGRNWSGDLYTDNSGAAVRVNDGYYNNIDINFLNQSHINVGEVLEINGRNNWAADNTVSINISGDNYVDLWTGNMARLISTSNDIVDVNYMNSDNNYSHNYQLADAYNNTVNVQLSNSWNHEIGMNISYDWNHSNGNQFNVSLDAHSTIHDYFFDNGAAFGGNWNYASLTLQGHSSVDNGHIWTSADNSTTFDLSVANSDVYSMHTSTDWNADLHINLDVHNSNGHEVNFYNYLEGGAQVTVSADASIVGRVDMYWDAINYYTGTGNQEAYVYLSNNSHIVDHLEIANIGSDTNWGSWVNNDIQVTNWGHEDIIQVNTGYVQLADVWGTYGGWYDNNMGGDSWSDFDGMTYWNNSNNTVVLYDDHAENTLSGIWSGIYWSSLNNAAADVYLIKGNEGGSGQDVSIWHLNDNDSFTEVAYLVNAESVLFDNHQFVGNFSTSNVTYTGVL